MENKPKRKMYISDSDGNIENDDRYQGRLKKLEPELANVLKSVKLRSPVHPYSKSTDQ